MNPAQGGLLEKFGVVSGSLLDILEKNGKLNNIAKEKAKMEFISHGVSPEEWLVKEKIINEDDIASANASYLNVPTISLSDRAISPVALGFVEKSLATRFNIIPFEYKPADKELYLAMLNPADLSAIGFVEKKTQLKVKPFAAMPGDLKNHLDTIYSQSLSTEVTAALKETGSSNEPEAKTINIRQMNEIIKEAPIAKIVTTVLEFAIKSRASDVHIEPLIDKTRVRYRIDGVLHEKLILPKKIHEALISRVKILSDMKIDEKRLPQDGRFNFQTDQEEVDLRVSSLPTAHGEKIVMRLLKKTGVIPTLPELGLRGMALKHLEEAILRPHGIILITGPTGSGKTTTLYSILSKISSVRVNIVTLEDPVEYQIAGVNQVQVNPAAGLTFASGLRSFLRQDPNVIMVGEVRDVETAELAVQASLTGHLVFSTLHTNSSSGALPRLLDMKAEPYLLASTITAIVGQRVARKICPHCKKAYLPNNDVIMNIQSVLGRLWQYPGVGITSYPPNVTMPTFQLYRGEGCQQCSNTGYLGRIGIFEVLSLSEKIGRRILEHASAGEIEKTAVEEGMITMKQDGYLKVVEGITTIEEVLRVAQE